MSTAVCVCGKEFEQESPMHTHCSPECYRDDSGRNRALQTLPEDNRPVEVDPTQYYQFLPTEGLQAEFPHLVAMNAHADVLGPCRMADWENVLAHAHSEDGIVCVKGPLNNLFEPVKGGVKPTSLFLHEYAHLELPNEWHTPRFAEKNKELHQKWKVAHDKKVEAIFSVIMSLVIISVGLGLYVVTGWGYIGIGAGIALLMNLGWVFNSFQQEQIEAHEHDMRRWREGNTSR